MHWKDNVTGGEEGHLPICWFASYMLVTETPALEPPPAASPLDWRGDRTQTEVLIQAVGAQPPTLSWSLTLSKQSHQRGDATFSESSFQLRLRE